MTHKYYVEYPKQMIERRLNFVIDRCPQLIHALDQNQNHPLIRETSHIHARCFIRQQI